MKNISLEVFCIHWVAGSNERQGSCARDLIAPNSNVLLCSKCGTFEPSQNAIPKKIAPVPEVAAVEPSLLTKAKEYLGVEYVNATRGGVTVANEMARTEICAPCPHRAIEYKGKKSTDGFGWCAKCSCGNNDRALLKSKVKMPASSCPLGLWGEVEGVGGSVVSLVDTARGLVDTAKHLLHGTSDNPNPDL